MKKLTTVNLACVVALTSTTTLFAAAGARAQYHDASERQKRWQSDGFVFQVEGTEPLVPRKDVITALEYGAATWNAVGAETEIHVEKSHSQGNDWESIAL